MPALKNQRHELFAQAVAQGKSDREAYRLAGYSENSAEQNAHRLRANEGVVSRIEEIRGKTARKVEVTLESLIADAEMIFKAAAAKGQFSAAVAALKEKGVLTGLRIEKREQGGPGEFEQMSDDELRDYLKAGALAARKGDEDAIDSSITPEMRAKPQ